MDYHEIPSAIKHLTDDSAICGYILQYEILRCRDNKTNKISITVGDRIVKVDSSELEVFLLKQFENNQAEINRLDDIHKTLTKVAVGLIK